MRRLGRHPYSELNNFTIWKEFEFITNIIGSRGPSYEQLLGHYLKKYPWITNTNQFLKNHDQNKLGLQYLTIPKTGKYSICAVGAGKSKFRGAIITGEFNLQRGDVLEVLVGQLPNDDQPLVLRPDLDHSTWTPICRILQIEKDVNVISRHPGAMEVLEECMQNTCVNGFDLSSGCGGTFVKISGKLLLAAGGGGGGGNFCHASESPVGNGNQTLKTTAITCKPVATLCGGRGYNDYNGNLNGREYHFEGGAFNKFCARVQLYNLDVHHSEWCNLIPLQPGTFQGGFGGGGAAYIPDNYITALGGNTKTEDTCTFGGGGGYTGGGFYYDDTIPAGGGGSFCSSGEGTKSISHTGSGKCTVKFLSE